MIRKMTKKTYDQKCYDLAEHFLDDVQSLNTTMCRESLAATIQAAIEDWFVAVAHNEDVP